MGILSELSEDVAKVQAEQKDYQFRDSLAEPSGAEDKAAEIEEWHRNTGYLFMDPNVNQYIENMMSGEECNSKRGG